MRVRTVLVAGLAGAAVAYLFDPIAGRTRRSHLRERIIAIAHRRMIPLGRRPPLPDNMIPAQAGERADAPEERPKEAAADTPGERPKEAAADTPGERPEEAAADTPGERPEEAAADTPGERPEEAAADTLEERPEEAAADTLEERPEEAAADTPRESAVDDIVYMPQERLRGYLADTREHRSMDDGAIVGRIRMKVLDRPDLETGSLLIDVVQGVAFLRGELKDRKAIEEIVDLTRSVPGVREVQNLLVIRLPESPAISRSATKPLGDAWNG